MKVGAAVLGSPSPISLIVSVDVKQHDERKKKDHSRTQKLRESRGGRPGLPDPNSP